MLIIYFLKAYVPRIIHELHFRRWDYLQYNANAQEGFPLFPPCSPLYMSAIVEVSNHVRMYDVLFFLMYLYYSVFSLLSCCLIEKRKIDGRILLVFWLWSSIISYYVESALSSTSSKHSGEAGGVGAKSFCLPFMNIHYFLLRFVLFCFVGALVTSKKQPAHF